MPFLLKKVFLLSHCYAEFLLNIYWIANCPLIANNWVQIVVLAFHPAVGYIVFQWQAMALLVYTTTSAHHTVMISVPWLLRHCRRQTVCWRHVLHLLYEKSFCVF